MIPPAAVTLLLLVTSFKYNGNGAFGESKQGTINVEMELTKLSQNSLLISKAISLEDKEI